MVNLSHNCDHKHTFFTRFSMSVWRVIQVICLAACSKAGGKDTDQYSPVANGIQLEGIAVSCVRISSTPFYSIEKS
jgi:hypothetical protein